MEKSILSYALKQYRLDHVMTQQELAEILEVSDKSISKWELGEGYPSKRNVLKISEVLNISLEALLIEQNQDHSKDLKQSIKYGLMSYVLLFALSMIITSLNMDFSNVIEDGPHEILKVLGSQFITNNFYAIVPAIIIGCVFYFYIFPNQNKED